MTNTKQPELLAPCGNREMMRAAVANGADAVYFGLEDFNARRRAENFALATLPETMEYLRSRNVRGYVTLNTLVFSQELPRAAEFVAGIAQAGADAVIVQDLGLARLVRRIAPTLPIHASTQMTQTHGAALEMLADLGVSRVILARELSLEMIAAIAQSPAVAQGRLGLEVFVHGALCVSYSGQCLASEGLMGRSANRGQCGQVCRLPYQLVVDGELRDQPTRQYLLSPRDLAAHCHVAELCRLGVAGLKIEGRLKNPNYVAAVVQVYRTAIDAAASSSGGSTITPAQQTLIEHTFSRGFSDGYLTDARGTDLVEGEFPASRGIELGRVASVRGQYVLLELPLRGNNKDEGKMPSTHADKMSASRSQPPVQAGDGIAMESSRSDSPVGGRVYAVEAYEDRRAGKRPRLPDQFVLTLPRDLDLSAVKVGGRVWKTDDPKVNKRIESTFSRDDIVHRIAVRAEVAGRAGGALTVSLSDGTSRVKASWAGPLSPASEHPLTEKLLREQLGRLGQTPFELAEVVLLDETGPVTELPVLAPKSVLNDLRRQTTDALVAERNKRAIHACANPRAIEELRAETNHRTGLPAPAEELSVLVRDIPQLQAVLDWQSQSNAGAVKTVYCEFSQSAEYAQAEHLAKVSAVAVGVALPRIVRPGEEKTVAKLLRFPAAAVLVRNLAELELARQALPGATLVADHSLNAANELTVDYLLGLGFARVTSACDLSWMQLAAMLPHANPDAMEIVLHHHLPMFHMQHCLAAGGVQPCNRPCREHRFDLQDRNSERHAVTCDILCRNTVHNSHAQSAAQFFGTMHKAGLRHFRIELLREDPRETHDLLVIYSRLLAGEDGGDIWQELQERQPLTRGTWVDKSDD